MERKTYFPPESQLRRIVTEQGICYSSNEEAKIDPDGTNADLEVKGYDQIDNSIEFD